MRRIKRAGRSVCILMTFILVQINVPVHSVSAVMVGTEAVLAKQDLQNIRVNVRVFLERQDIQSLLSAYGIDPNEAKVRVDSLSDAEVMQITDKIDQLPAGSSFAGTVVYLVIIILLVLLITELLGYTDII